VYTSNGVPYWRLVIVTIDFVSLLTPPTPVHPSLPPPPDGRVDRLSTVAGDTAT